MFKNDRFMTIITGMILAIFAGTMVRYGDRIMAMMAGENQLEVHDDFYSVRSGSTQTFDLLVNDAVLGPIVLLSQPSCGVVSLAEEGKVQFSKNSDCSGEIFFAYCVESDQGCASNNVTINVVAINGVASTTQETPEPETVQEIDAEDNDPIENNSVGEPENDAPVVEIVRADPAESSAPIVEQITLSIQAPFLAAPSVDEFLSPSAATAGIRIQSSLVAETAENLDHNIVAQSSAAVADNSGIAVAGFSAPVIEDNGASGISLGAAPTNIIPPNQSAVNTVTLVAPQTDTPIEQIASGPVALANLPENNQSGFGSGNTPFQESPPGDIAMLEGVTVDTTADTQLLAQLDNQARDPIVIATGPTALIALQVVGAPNGAENIGEDMSLILSEPGEQTLATLQPAPRLQAQDSTGQSAVSILEREPVSLSFAPEIYRNASIENFSPGAGVLLTDSLNVLPTTFAISAPLTENAGDSGNALLALVALGFSIDRLSPLVQAPFLPSQMFTGAADPVRLVSYDNEFPIYGALQPLAGPSGGTVQLPDVNLTPAPAPRKEPDVEVASLDENNSIEPQVDVAVEQHTTCDIMLDLSVRSGANILLFVTAECRPNAPVTIAHAGLEFTVLTDDAGTANVVFPAMERAAGISATFVDGLSTETTAIVPRIDEVTRAAVTWRSAVDLDLHALEYGAARGTEGHVWSGAPRDARTARVNGGGYLDVLGDPGIEGGAMTEVYTMPIGRSQQRGVVVMSLEILDGSPVCGANITANTVRSQGQDGASARSIRFKMLGCDQNQTNITIPRAVADIRLAGR